MSSRLTILRLKVKTIKGVQRYQGCPFLIICLLQQNVPLSPYTGPAPKISSDNRLFQFSISSRVCREYDDNSTEEETLVAFGLAANLTRSDDNEWSEPC